MKKRIGLLGGTFDPIHFGHLNLGMEMQEHCDLDQVIFCPAYLSPGKQHTAPVASKEDRLQMLLIALEDFPKRRVYEKELFRPFPSYTIATVKELLQESPNDQFYIIVGEDAASSLPNWKQFETLLQLAPPLIGRRETRKERLQSFRENLIEIALMEISSKEIRERLKNHLYCGHLVPSKVLDYIHRYRLYSSHCSLFEK